MFTSDETQLIIKGLKEVHKQKVEFEGLSTDTIQARMAKLQNYIDSCYEDKLEGNIPTELWQKKTNNWLQEKDTLMIKLEALNKANKEYLINAEMILELCKDAYSMFFRKTPKERRKMLNLLCSNFSYANGNLSPELIPPFDAIFEFNKQKTTANTGITSVEGEKTENLNKKILPRLDSNQQPTG